jgi:hypothetical protein
VVCLIMQLELTFGLAAKGCVCTNDIRTVVRALMFCDVFVSFCRRPEPFIEPSAIEAWAPIHHIPVESSNIGAGRGIYRKCLDSKPHSSENVI